MIRGQQQRFPRLVSEREEMAAWQPESRRGMSRGEVMTAVALVVALSWAMTIGTVWLAYVALSLFA